MQPASSPPDASDRGPASAAPDAPRGRFAFVDALRGIAALSVAAYHIDRYPPLREPAAVWIPDFVKFHVEHGWAGVQMFFVISGFVIAYSIRGVRITPGYLGNFALRRSLRLDPPYWTIIAVMLALEALTPYLKIIPSTFETPPRAGQVVAHLFYVQNILGYENISVGFWTLCIEVQFYLLLVIFTGIAQRLTWAGSDPERGASGLSLMLVFAPLAVASLFYFHLDGGNDDWLVHFFCMFFLGSLAWWTLEGRVPKALFWLYVLAMIVRLTMDWAVDLAIALGAGIAIHVAGRRGRLADWGNQRGLQFLGRISYSLYLIHYPISHVIVHTGHALTGDSSVAALFWVLLSLAASIGAAYLLYLCVEAPSVRLAARLKQPVRRPPAAMKTVPVPPVADRVTQS